jgi:hypothetical protein
LGRLASSSTEPRCSCAAIAQIDRAKLFEIRQLREPGVGHLRPIQAQFFGLGHSANRIEPRVSHARRLEIQSPQFGQSAAREARVRDPDVRKIQLREIRQITRDSERPALVTEVPRKYSLVRLVMPPSRGHPCVIEKSGHSSDQVPQRKDAKRSNRNAGLPKTDILQREAVGRLTTASSKGM